MKDNLYNNIIEGISKEVRTAINEYEYAATSYGLVSKLQDIEDALISITMSRNNNVEYYRDYIRTYANKLSEVIYELKTKQDI